MDKDIKTNHSTDLNLKLVSLHQIQGIHTTNTKTNPHNEFCLFTDDDDANGISNNMNEENAYNTGRAYDVDNGDIGKNSITILTNIPINKSKSVWMSYKKSSINQIDVYLETTELLYHNCNDIKSISLLENESFICYEIIAFKQRNGYSNYMTWEVKKNGIDVNIVRVYLEIENGDLTYDQYTKMLKDKLESQKKLFALIAKDKRLEAFEVTRLKERINERIDILETELRNKNEPMQFKIRRNIDINSNSLLTAAINRLVEYKTAIEYFQHHKLFPQLKDALYKAKSIIREIELIKEGEKKGKGENELNLPQQITPEYIFGYSNNELNEKYKIIFNYFHTHINQLKQKISVFANELSLLNNNEHTKIIIEIQNEIKEMKIKKHQLESILQTVSLYANDFWTPAPLYTLIDEKERTVRINSDIPLHSLLIYLGQTNYTKNQAFAVISIDNKTTAPIKPKSSDNYGSEFMFSFTQQEYMELISKTLIIQICCTQ